MTTGHSSTATAAAASGAEAAAYADGSSVGSSAAAATEAAEGDYVVLWATHSLINGVVLKSGTITNNRFGSFYHDDIIGLPYGSKVRPRRGGRWLAVLRPTPELITQSLVHRTQIIYHADISLLLALLDVGPGKVVVEAGTGSGSVSASLARAVRPSGRLHTFEFHEARQRQAVEDFRRQGMDDVVVSRHGDVCADGFGDALRDDVDAIFLDLPAPWLAVPHVDKCLVEGGKICTFSPCIEQIQRTAGELRRRRYQGVRMMETLAVNWGVKAESQSKRRRVGGEDAAAGRGGKGGRRSAKGGGKRRGRGKADANADASEASEEGGDDADDGPDSVAAVAPEGATLAPQPAATNWLSFQLPMRGHTGFLLVATRPPHDEP